MRAKLESASPTNIVLSNREMRLLKQAGSLRLGSNTEIIAKTSVQILKILDSYS